MKKIQKFIALPLAMLMLASCGENPSESTTSQEIVYKYEEEQMYQRYWEGNVVYNETCLLTEGEDGVIKARLMYTPKRIISVRDYTLQKEYSSSEYTIEGDYIIRTENSTMPYFTKGNLDCSSMIRYDGMDLNGVINKYAGKNQDIPFTEGTGIVMHQIAITYEHDDNWFGSLPQQKGDLLPNLQSKLKNKEDIKLVVNGDSIFTGCNSSGKLGIEPYQDDFPTAFAKEIERNYGSTVDLVNTAVGGQVSSWGAKNVVNNINQYNPDLVIIGFGMNDGCDAFQVSATDYVGNIETMIKSIQANTNAEIIVCSTILANPLSKQDCIQQTYLEPLKTMVNEYEGVALMDMTTFSKDLLTKKKALDMYANDINHPSDFLVRGYVMNLMTTIEEK